MKRLLVVTLVLCGLLATQAAAHYSGGWYWSESYAARKIEAKYSDVVNAECESWGRPFKGRLYKHFDCFIEYEDDETGEILTEDDELHVTGRRGFTLVD